MKDLDRLLSYRLPRRDFLRLGLVGGVGLLAEAACGERSRLGAPQTPKEIIDARQAREEAVRQGSFRIPEPKGTFRVLTQNISFLYRDGKQHFFVAFMPYAPLDPSGSTPSLDNLFPALLDGEVVEVLKDGERVSIAIKDGEQIWKFDCNSANPLVSLGEKVSLGNPILDLNPTTGNYIEVQAYRNQIDSASRVNLDPSDMFLNNFIPTLPKPKRN